MNKALVVEKDIFIRAEPMKVWQALTTGSIIKQYFFGTEAFSDWEIGSDLVFRGEWEGKSYEDKGHILKVDPGAKLVYDYWSEFSGLEDIPENYAKVSYHLSGKEGGTRLNLKQEGFANADAQAHSEVGWATVLDNLKNLLEA